MLLKNNLNALIVLEIKSSMILKIAKARQYLIKVSLAIIKATALWAIGLCLQPQTIAVAEPAIDVEDISTAIVVKKINVKGYTIFSDKEIDKIIELYRGKELNFSQLRNITEAITDLYVSRGYITSGAFLPPQEIVDGIVNIQVVEGKLEDLKIEGLKYLQENYVRSFISSAETSSNSDSDNIFAFEQSSPLNIENLEEELRLLERDPSIATINAELVEGTEPNLSVLLIEVEETSPFDARLSFDNYRSPSVGEFQGTLETSYRNIIGEARSRFCSIQFNRRI